MVVVSPSDLPNVLPVACQEESSTALTCGHSERASRVVSLDVPEEASKAETRLLERGRHGGASEGCCGAKDGERCASSERCGRSDQDALEHVLKRESVRVEGWGFGRKERSVLNSSGSRVGTQVRPVRHVDSFRPLLHSLESKAAHRGLRSSFLSASAAYEGGRSATADQPSPDGLLRSRRQLGQSRGKETSTLDYHLQGRKKSRGYFFWGRWRGTREGVKE